MADHWLGIDSTKLDSYCGSTYGFILEDALDGIGKWFHDEHLPHWFIIDLVETYTIKKVRGRSDSALDPLDVDIYVSDSKTVWGDAVKTGIDTWQVTEAWVEIDTTVKDGRYIKVNINTEDMMWGKSAEPWMTIFDAYGDVAAPPYVPKPTVAVGNPLMFQVMPTPRTPLYRRKPRLHRFRL